MIYDYSKRSINRVFVHGFNRSIDEDGEAFIGATVVVGMDGSEGGFSGPDAKVEFALLQVEGETWAAMENRFLEAARAILSRLAAEPVEALREKRDEAQRDDFLSKQDFSKRPTSNGGGLASAPIASGPLGS